MLKNYLCVIRNCIDESNTTLLMNLIDASYFILFVNIEADLMEIVFAYIKIGQIKKIPCLNKGRMKKCILSVGIILN